MPVAHAGYLRAVAAALEAAGVPVADWRADARVPRDGWIAFDLARPGRLPSGPPTSERPRPGRPAPDRPHADRPGGGRQLGRAVWDHDTAGLVWHEEAGWSLHTVDDPGGRDVRTTLGLDLALVAEPRSVAAAVARLAALPPPAADPDGPGDRDFPGHRAGVADGAFEEALRAYG